MSNYIKARITATLEVLTGLHVGASNAFAAIGATDSPVIKDPLTNRPVIPGSSIKGKMRTLLARAYNETPALSHNQDSDLIKSLFGATSPNIQAGKLIFRDLVMDAEEEKRLRERGVRSLTEVKFENTINRKNAMANPRQIERIFRNTRFGFELIYDSVSDTDGAPATDNQIEQDFKMISDGIRLIELDYLGGHGTRGYGRVEFRGLGVVPVYGSIGEELLEKLNRIIKRTA